MKYRSTLIAFCLALIFSFAVAADSPKSAVPALHELTMNMVAKIHVGISTRAQLRELLGTPWRTTNYSDCNPVDYQEIWEYLGRGADDAVRITVMFDEAGIVRLVAKTPAKGPTVVLAYAPKPQEQHQH